MRVRDRDALPAYGKKKGVSIRKKKLSRSTTAYLFMLPALIAVTLVQLIPMLSGIGMSLTRLTQYTIGDWLHAPFTVANYAVAYAPTSAIAQSLLSSFVVTLTYTGVVVALSWLFGMAASVFLAGSTRVNKILRGLFIIPYAIPAFAGIMVWTTMFQPDGAVNAVLGKELNLVGPDTLWLAGGPGAFTAMCVTALWRSWPFAFLMLLATVQSIPAELYEAGDVDGASHWQAFRYITFPSVRSVSGLLALILGFWTFNDFATPFIMFGTAVPESANLISSEIYVTSFADLNFGLGAAMSMGVIVFLLIVAVFYVRFMRKELRGVFE